MKRAVYAYNGPLGNKKGPENRRKEGCGPEHMMGMGWPPPQNSAPQSRTAGPKTPRGWHRIKGPGS